jgi:hypothetical protein
MMFHLEDENSSIACFKAFIENSTFEMCYGCIMWECRTYSFHLQKIIEAYHIQYIMDQNVCSYKIRHGIWSREHLSNVV